MMPKLFPVLRAIALLCLLIPMTCFALSYTVKIDAPPDLMSLLTLHLPLYTEQQDPDLDAAGLDALLRATPDSARQLLETEGYFSAEVRAWAEPGGQIVHVEVRPGAPVTVSSVELRLLGAIHNDADYSARYQSIQNKWPLSPGAVFRQAAWASGKRQALEQLLADRFPLAQINDSRIEIDPATRRARVLLVLDSGPEVRFGALEVRGLKRYPRYLVDSLADFKPGDPYSTQALQDFQTALGSSSQFSGAIVNADPQRIVAGVIPVEVELTESPLKKLDLGLTYDTDVGPGTRVGFEHYNVFGRAWTGSSVWTWNPSETSLAAGLSMPRTSDGYVNSLTVALQKTDIQGLITESQEIGVWRTRTKERGDLRFGLDYIQENQHAVNEPSETNRALLPTFGWTGRFVDSLLHPRSGGLLDGTLSATPGGALSSTDFVRAYGRGAVYWTPKPSWGTLMARLELGQVWARDVNRVPESELFRAGGVNSVRGFDYQSLGLAGPNGSVLGGAVVATASLEYQIPLVTDWALALFTDAGNAAQSWQGFQVNHSRGIGVRWFSPVAPFSLDVAQARGKPGVMLHMSLGLAF